MTKNELGRPGLGVLVTRRPSLWERVEPLVNVVLRLTGSGLVLGAAWMMHLGQDARATALVSVATFSWVMSLTGPRRSPQ